MWLLTPCLLSINSMVVRISLCHRSLFNDLLLQTSQNNRGMKYMDPGANTSPQLSSLGQTSSIILM